MHNTQPALLRIGTIINTKSHTLFEGVKPYACPVCGCRFHLVHNMKRHIQTHEEQGDIEHGTADGLVKAAEATASSPRPSTQVRCKIYGLIYYLFHIQIPAQIFLNIILKCISLNSQNLQLNFVLQANLKCNICNKWFSNATRLGQHMVVHDRDKPHVCSICGWRWVNSKPEKCKSLLFCPNIHCLHLGGIS